MNLKSIQFITLYCRNKCLGVHDIAMKWGGEKNKKISSKKRLTKGILKDRITKHVTERYRSGHNEAVLKTVCPQGRVGSNPTLSASHQ